MHSFDPASGQDRSWSTPAQPGGVLLDAAGEVLVAAPEGLAELDQDSGAQRLRVPIEQEKPENRANDVKVDAHGRAWVGTMAFDKRPGNAALYRVEGDDVTCVVDGLTISNGPAFDESAGRLYLADTARCTVDVFDLDAATGSATGRRRFLDFTDQQVWPDGMTVDDAGMFWVALGRAGAVHRYRPDGTLDGVVEVPTSNPTSLAFGGPTGAPSTSPPPGSTSTRTTATPSLWPARSSSADQVSTGPPSPRYGHAPSLATRIAAASPTLPSHERQPPMIEHMVLFGASGDLTSRLLLPAVAQLAEAGQLPPGFTILGAANEDWSTDDFRQHIAAKLEGALGRGSGHPAGRGRPAHLPAHRRHRRRGGQGTVR